MNDRDMATDLPHAVVTGGSRGIGLAIVDALLSTHHVTMVGRTRKALEDAARCKSDRGPGRIGIAIADVTDEAQLFEGIAKARGEFGPVNLLVNNAGAASSLGIKDLDGVAFRQSLELNLVQVHLASRLALPDMLVSGWGRIVNIASTAGVKGYPYVSAYCAAKHGVIGLTRAYALELASKNITVNAICPGYADTEMTAGQLTQLSKRTGQPEDKVKQKLLAGTPSGRLVDPKEIATAVCWLAGREAASVTGQAIVIAGGEYMAG